MHFNVNFLLTHLQPTVSTPAGIQDRLSKKERLTFNSLLGIAMNCQATLSYCHQRAQTMGISDYNKTTSYNYSHSHSLARVANSNHPLHIKYKMFFPKTAFEI